MRYGKNEKGREFEALPWYYGEVWIRRDEEIVKERDQRAKDWFEAHGRWWLYEAA